LKYYKITWIGTPIKSGYKTIFIDEKCSSMVSYGFDDTKNVFKNERTINIPLERIKSAKELWNVEEISREDFFIELI